MDNPQLGRKILDIADFETERFDMLVWGMTTSCGTAACLAGHTLLQSGYKLDGGENFLRPDGTPIPNNPGEEARQLLGMTRGEVTFSDMELPLWVDFNHGLERFRAIVERAEKEGSE